MGKKGSSSVDVVAWNQSVCVCVCVGATPLINVGCHQVAHGQVEADRHTIV
jgi:hypothetical protein